ncbi:jg3771 [Pararge aegeria aegeria]|uniref:Jg3771 protein n=1 Tax=Pararge aegeria aegeria TaxID=348720 RepID=A0A8S4SNN2_9NEOP|nr:jg3771 [Pararge aegeria aegeria]
MRRHGLCRHAKNQVYPPPIDDSHQKTNFITVCSVGVYVDQSFQNGLFSFSWRSRVQSPGIDLIISQTLPAQTSSLDILLGINNSWNDFLLRGRSSTRWTDVIKAATQTSIVQYSRNAEDRNKDAEAAVAKKNVSSSITTTLLRVND